MGRRSTVLAIALCTAAVGSHALSMGPSRGTVVIGQPLNLSFDVNLDPGSDAASACAGAELYYGETRLDPSRFRVTALPGAQPSQAVVQVASQVAVNEPVVSVVLRAGCGQTLSRRYVLLSASPQETPAPAYDAPVVLRALPPVAADAGPGTSAAAPPAARRPRAARAPAPENGAVGSGPATAGERAAGLPSAAAQARPARAPQVPRVAAVNPPAPAAGRGRSRLELQSPADWLADADVPLQPSLSLNLPATAASAEQREAAAALWRSLSSDSAEGPARAPLPAAEAERLQKLEQQLKVLQDSVARSHGHEAELQAQLDEARSEGDRSRLFLWPALFVVLLAVLALGMGIYRRRTGKRSAWWKPARSAPDGLGGNTTSMYTEPDFVDTMPSVLGEATLPDAVEFYPSRFPPRMPGEGDTLIPAPAPASRHGDEEDEDDDDGVAASAAEVAARAMVMASKRAAAEAAKAAEKGAAPTPAPAPAAIGGAAVTAAGAAETVAVDSAPQPPIPDSIEAATAAARELRTGSTEALFDVQQNAEFFASVGQYEEAIDALQHYIDEHPGSSPAAYLDLLRMLHTLSQTEPYRKLRDDFNRVFNAEMPAFAGFLKPTRGLEAFPEALHRIERAWNRPQVLDVIEVLLFRRLAGDGMPPFSQEAYRELLMLYEIAKAGYGSVSAAPPPPPPPAPAPAPAYAPPVQPPVPAPPPARPPLQEPPSALLLQDFPERPLQGRPPAVDLGAPLDFAEPSASLLPDFELPPSSPPPPDDTLPAPTRGFAAPPSADNNLIDFDLFDVKPTAGKK